MINIDFTYVSKFGDEFSGRLQCHNYDEADSIIENVMEWCKTNRFKMKRIDINYLD